MNKFLAIFIILFLVSCKVGPDYKKPEINPLNSWFGNKNDKISLNEKSEINQQWWINFNDEDLTKLINLAFAQNLDIKIAANRIIQSREESSISKAGFLPIISAEAQSSKGNTMPGIPFKSGNNKFSAFDFNASWEIDFFGRKRRLFESAKALENSKEFSKNATIVSVAAEVARNYVLLRQLQNQLQLQQENIDLMDKKISLEEKKNKAGAISDADFARFLSNLDSEKAKLPTLKNSVNQTIRNIEMLIGKEPGYLDEMLAQTKAIPASSAKIVIAAPAQIIRNRPDINAAEQQLISANAMEGAAIANLYPRVSLTALLGYQNYEVINSGVDGKTELVRSLGISGSIPIFDFGKLKAQTKVAKASNKEALLNYEKTILMALNEVQNNISAYSEEINRQNSLSSAVKNNEKFYQATQKSYKKGEASLIEEIDAKMSLNEKKSMFITSQAESAINLILLYKSLGGGWEKQESNNVK